MERDKLYRTYSELSKLKTVKTPREWDCMFEHSEGLVFRVCSKGYIYIWGSKWRCGDAFHRVITSCPKDMVVDHIDRCPWNNELSNLRVTTHSVNNHNKGLLKSNRSGAEGVYYEKRSGKWVAEIVVNKVRYRKRAHDRDSAIEHRLAMEMGNLGHNKYNISPRIKPKYGVRLYFLIYEETSGILRISFSTSKAEGYSEFVSFAKIKKIYREMSRNMVSGIRRDFSARICDITTARSDIITKLDSVKGRPLSDLNCRIF